MKDFPNFFKIYIYLSNNILNYPNYGKHNKKR